MFDEVNLELDLAEQFVRRTGCNLFLSGKAGTGKTTFLHRIRQTIDKRHIVLAPTGVAAINAGGVTIHSFFGLSFAPYVPDTTLTRQDNKRYYLRKEKIKIIRTLDLLIIDEISMVRADVLDQIDETLRRIRHDRKPFGGVQLLLIGDLHQLAPVTTSADEAVLRNHYETYFFFGSHALRKTEYISIELQKVYRQSNEDFISLLNHIRNNTATQSTFNTLNKRYEPSFTPRDEDGYITLTTHNHQADTINERHLAELPGEQFQYTATVKGTFPENSYPMDECLTLRVGAQVMFTKNSKDCGFFNGKIGRVVGLGRNSIQVLCDDEPEPLEVPQMIWENAEYKLDDETREIRENVIGTFTHYPLRLAWAITIHKSQGLTFDRVIIDAAQAFASGQVYVALSRCRTLEGIVLSSRLNLSGIIIDQSITAFDRSTAERRPDRQYLSVAERAFCLQCIGELFDFQPLHSLMKHLERILDEHLYKVYPALINRFKTINADIPVSLLDVSKKFEAQYTALIDSDQNELQARITAAAGYFKEKLKTIRELLNDASHQVQPDNKVIAKQWSEVLQSLATIFNSKLLLMADTSYTEGGFSVSRYLKQRADSLLPPEHAPQKAHKTPAKSSPRAMPPQTESDVKHPILFEALRKWRMEEATKLDQPPFIIMHQISLIQIANSLPCTAKELLSIPKIGKRKVELYGEAILTIVEDYLSKHTP